MKPNGIRNEHGMALFMALLMLVVLATLAVGAIMMSGNASLLGKYHAKDAEMRASADAGLEWARDTINGTLGILPAVGFDTLQLRLPVRDAGGTVIPGFTRSVFIGRSGTTTGQFGVYASVISRIDDNAGRAVVVRRAELAQESFSQFARFDDVTTSSVVFANGIQVFGPIHTNGILYVGASPGNPAIFHARATTSATVQTASNGTFRQGYKTGVPRINLPTPAALATLSGYATTAQLFVTGGALGPNTYDPRTRIEFVALDLDNDGDFTDENEGFIRVYRGKDTNPGTLNYVTARRWSAAAGDPNTISPNCGDVAGAPANFLPASAHIAGGPVVTGHNHNLNMANNQKWSLATAASRRCYLGGDPRLTNGWIVGGITPAAAPNDYGAWVPWPGYAGGPAPAAIAAGVMHPSFGIAGQIGADQARFLWPINRPFNPNYNGVIYVDGSVGISGVLRGQVTIAAAGNVMLADDLIYVTAPGSVPDCDKNIAQTVYSDMLGVLTPEFFVIEDNNVNSPFQVNNAYVKGHDETPDETIHGAVLTLNSVMSEALGTGSTNSEVCGGTPIGRGCFNMVGAAIQGVNAGRMQGGTGWNPQWTYDRCDAIKGPPYFPTTGRYYKNRYYEIDPVGFSVAGWFAANQ